MDYTQLQPLFNRRNLFYLVSIVISVTGCIIIGKINRFGGGITYDSIYYISGARSILNGDGYVDMWGKPIVNWPPFYSLLIAFISIFNNDTIASGNIINIFVFGASLWVFSKILFIITMESLPLTIWGSIAILCNLDILYIHQMIWSEASFFLFILLTLLFFIQYQKHYSKKYLIFGSIATTFSIFTRYAGIILIFVGIFTILNNKTKTGKQKINDILYFASLPFLLFLLWILRNKMSADSAFERTIQFFPLEWADLNVLLTTVKKWLIPIDRLLYISLLCLPLLIKNKVTINNRLLIFPIFFFFLMYLGIVFVFRLFMYNVSNDAFEYRLTSPLLYPILLLFIWYISISLRTNDLYNNLIDITLKFLTNRIRLKIHSWTKTITNAAIYFLAIMALYHLIIFAKIQLRELKYYIPKQTDAIGYNSSSWRSSPLINQVKSIPDKSIIYCNDPEIVYILTERKSISVYNNKTTYTCKNNAYYVLFKDIESRPINNYISVDHKKIFEDTNFIILQYP